ncbi:S-adenosyl-L-methionine-dependent methyltransferase [Hesseltinella vesiculosa]|uniref:S-adenosyl-L-methionine-dependent methyltransferase n=1 Tax=Hesseltinella vesiculosa TaxID=101127 RepID=A0A1X2GW27_9FUNG|nr:S-adenosyl-L-methionine-dependent methyltransferase [Hesseltinella vesiculosa]
MSKKGITYEKGQWLFSMDRLRLQPDHVQSRVRLLQGSATDLVTALRPDTDLPFDNVLCLDAAYHFNTRALFFRQVTHVLKPGGCLGMYDLILSPSFSTRRSLPWKWRVLAKALDIPLVNWMNQQQYEAQLTQAGFDDVDIELLDPAVVFGGLSAHCFKQLSLVNHWHLGHWTHAAYLRVSGYLFGYLATAECWMPAIITARRPLSAGQSAHADKK